MSKLPGLPPGPRAAQLLDSNVELPGGFLELFGKPVRESACECERTERHEPRADPGDGQRADRRPTPSRTRTTASPSSSLAEKDDAKVVEEIYLAVLNRCPTAKESEAGRRGAPRRRRRTTPRWWPSTSRRSRRSRRTRQTLDAKQKAWEDGLRSQKPTTWTPLDVDEGRVEARPTPAAADGAKLTINKDGSVLASGKPDAVDIYTVVGTAKLDEPITAIRLEVLADPSLPAKGPGRADNGNFVLNEFRRDATGRSTSRTRSRSR